VTLGRAPEGVGDLSGGRPEAHAFERHEAAPVIVDDAEEPNRYDAEQPHESEVGSPELAGSVHVNATRLLAALVFEQHDQIAAADENLPDGLAGRGEAEDSGGEPAELAGAEMRKLDMEANDFLFDVVRRPVPGAMTPRDG
jgi:hypothetical protein